METDYLVIGAGALGMAFVDTLLDEAPDVHVTLVDRRPAPGGHWNDAYAFVGLHQPSSFYGVNSSELGSGRIDDHGPNAGFHELASGPEVTAYFDRVLRQRFLPSGRVAWFSSSEHRDGDRVVNLFSGAETRVSVRRRVVDATFVSPAIPATHARGFAVADAARVVAPGALPRLWLDRATGAEAAPPAAFCVLGAGKTGMDAIVWLLRQGVPPEAIQWVVPRDSWLQNRRGTQPGLAFFDASLGGEARRMAAFADAASIDDVFLRLEAVGSMLRVDPSQRPTMFHYATVSEGELALLRSVQRVVRLGRVREVQPDALVLEGGRVPLEPGTVCIDCTASGVRATRPPEPVFQPGRIAIQLLRQPLVTLSAAITAWVEAHVPDDAARNALCTPVPFPRSHAGYARAVLGTLQNQLACAQVPALRQWMRGTRLDAFGALAASIAKDDAPRQAVLRSLRETTARALPNIAHLAAAAEADAPAA